MRNVNGIRYRQGFGLQLGESLHTYGWRLMYDNPPTRAYFGPWSAFHICFSRGIYGASADLSFGARRIVCVTFPFPITAEKRMQYQRLGDKYKEYAA